MKLYYEIADHVICIECETPELIESIKGFSEFRIECSENCVTCIKVEVCEPQPVEGERFHRVETPFALCLLYHTNRGNGLEIKQCNELRLSLLYNMEDRTCVIKGHPVPELLQYALWLTFNFSVADLKTVAIHSSSIVYQNNAFLYLGESGTGKSTHARLLCQYLTGSELLNDDSPILRVVGNQCFVYGSPWSGKTPCYKQKKAILTGITRLCQAPRNLIQLLPLHKAVGALLPSFPPELYLNNKLQYHVIDLISNVLDSIKVCMLECLPNKEAAEVSINFIRRYWTKLGGKGDGNLD